MSNIFERRFEVARKEAERVNRLLRVGYLAVIDENEQIETFDIPFTITADEIVQVIEYKRGKTTYRWFYHNPEYDEGSHTPEDEIRERFRRIKFYERVPDFKLKLYGDPPTRSPNDEYD